MNGYDDDNNYNNDYYGGGETPPYDNDPNEYAPDINTYIDATGYGENGWESLLGEGESELTEAELEDIKRERAARRRKLAARERRRKERRKQAIIRCSIFLAIVILIFVGIIKAIAGAWNHFHKPKDSKKSTEQVVTTQQATTEAEIKAQIDESIVAKDLPVDRAAALTILQAQAATDPDIKSICDNESVYPDSLLQYLAVNEEMKQFVLDYPTKIIPVYDGDFSVEVSGSEIPLYLQFDERWGYADYGKRILGINGNGPACLSMAYTYLMNDGSMNPIRVGDFSMEHNYIDEQGITNWKLMTEGAELLGLSSKELSLDKQSVINALKEGKVVICSMSPGDFTRDNSYIIIRQYKDGLFYVNDPCSEARSNVGWDFSRLSDQISILWELEKGSGVVTNTEDTYNTSSDNQISNTTEQTAGVTTEATTSQFTTTESTSGVQSTDQTSSGTQQGSTQAATTEFQFNINNN